MLDLHHTTAVVRLFEHGYTANEISIKEGISKHKINSILKKHKYVNTNNTPIAYKEIIERKHLTIELLLKIMEARGIPTKTMKTMRSIHSKETDIEFHNYVHLYLDELLKRL